MKVYSDVLHRADLTDACRGGGFWIDRCKTIVGARVRSRGWKVRLTGSSTRHRNSGNYGAATWDSPPATWDEHGEWMAFLFERDPSARIAEYDGADAFHYSTGDKYRRVPA